VTQLELPVIVAIGRHAWFIVPAIQQDLRVEPSPPMATLTLLETHRAARQRTLSPLRHRRASPKGNGVRRARSKVQCASVADSPIILRGAHSVAPPRPRVFFPPPQKKPKKKKKSPRFPGFKQLSSTDTKGRVAGNDQAANSQTPAPPAMVVPSVRRRWIGYWVIQQGWCFPDNTKRQDAPIFSLRF